MHCFRVFNGIAIILVLLGFLFLLAGWIASFSSAKTFLNKPESFWYSNAPILFLAGAALFLGVIASSGIKHHNY